MHFSKLLTLTAATLAFAHPGEKHDHEAVKREIRLRDALAEQARHGVNACSNSHQARQVQQRSVSRRANTARDLRSKRGVTAGKQASAGKP